jgi:hypothetical protein
MKKIILIYLILIFTAYAITFKERPKLPTLFKEAPYIVVVSCISNLQDFTGIHPYTTTEFKILEVIAGDLQKEEIFQVKQFGGIGIDRTIVPPWAHVFKLNEDYMLLMNKYDDKFVLLQKGVIHLEKDKTGNHIVPAHLLKLINPNAEKNFSINNFKKEVEKIRKN